MKRLVCAAAILIASFPPATAHSQAAPTTIHALATLPNAVASRRQPVTFQATVTYYRADENGLFVQEGGDAIYVAATRNYYLLPGDRVLVEGTTHESFRPYVVSSNITRIGRGALPLPVHPTFTQMVDGQTDCKLVTVRAVIRSAVAVPVSGVIPPRGFLRMLVDGGPVDANIDNANASFLNGILDDEVEMTGVMSGHFDAKMQQTGILLHLQSPAGLKILKRASSDPWSLPVTPMDRILTGFHALDHSQRMRVQGTVTYYQPGAALVLQDGSKSLWITTDSFTPLQIGDSATVIGFPDVQNGFLALAHSQVRSTSAHPPVKPALSKWRDLALGGNDATSHIFDLVAIEGQVVAQVRQPTQDVYVLNSGGFLFSATLDHPSPRSQAPLPAMTEIPLGASIRVTGICIPENSNPFTGEVPFNILMRSPDDIAIVAQPPWMNARHVVMLAGLLLVIVLILGARGWLLEHKVRREIGSLAYVEQRRGRILESINSSEPLAEILERVTELVSVRLNGAPCWCRIADGAALGNRPLQPDSPSLRTVEYPIGSRSGPPLGTIYAAFDAHTKPTTIEREALVMAAGLATLAIETSRLYADLVRRSEFDVLTDVQNRFALERTLNAMIHNARQSAGIFAMVFIDLNDFKQVNDLHGHLVGDLYLQEVAQRMKRQLRPCDTLGRVGGDEFAVLVPDVRNRAEVEEIAARLEACFVEPFAGDGYVLHGSASIGIALYPEDATTAGSLLSTADAAMYLAKYSKKRQRPDPVERDSSLAPEEHV